MINRFLLRWLFNGIALYLATRVVPGLSAPDTLGVIIAALVLGLLNASIRWLLLILTLPINILTLGLFTLVVNAVMLYLVAAIVPGSLQIASFWTAFWGALLIAIISTILNHFARR